MFPISPGIFFLFFQNRLTFLHKLSACLLLLLQYLGTIYLGYWRSQRKGSFGKFITRFNSIGYNWPDVSWTQFEDNFGMFQHITEPQSCLTVSSVYNTWSVPPATLIICTGVFFLQPLPLQWHTLSRLLIITSKYICYWVIQNILLANKYNSLQSSMFTA